MHVAVSANKEWRQCRKALWNVNRRNSLVRSKQQGWLPLR
jgi:hypothetical protein